MSRQRNRGGRARRMHDHFQATLTYVVGGAVVAYKNDLYPQDSMHIHRRLSLYPPTATVPESRLDLADPKKFRDARANSERGGSSEWGHYWDIGALRTPFRVDPTGTFTLVPAVLKAAVERREARRPDRKGRKDASQASWRASPAHRMSNRVQECLR